MNKITVILFSVFSLFLLLISNCAYTLGRPAFSRLIIFGDSLSDTGKMYAKSGGLIPADNPPLQWSTTLYYNGRFSNGLVWVDYLKSDYAMLDKQIADEAEGGATLYDYSTKSWNPVYWMINNFNYEISQFLDKVSHQNVSAINDQDIVVIWVGSNDLLSNGWMETSDVYDDMSKLYLGVDTLVAAGAKNFVIINLPELSLTPEASQMTLKQKNKLSQATAKFNEQLALATQAMAQFYAPSGVMIKSYNALNLFNDALSNPDKYDLTNTTDACYMGPVGGVFFPVAQEDGTTTYPESIKKLAKKWNVPEDQLVSYLKSNPVFANSFQWVSKEDQQNNVELEVTDSFNPSSCQGHLFFDAVHPTTEVHQVLSEKLKVLLDQNWKYQSLS